MTVGQWFGQWFGSWYGSGEPAPEGSLSGATTLCLSGTATLTGTGAMAGTASVSLASNGTLTTGAAGSLAGTAAFSIAATGTATSANIPVGTGEYPFFSEGFWSAGFFSDGFWGTPTVPEVVEPPMYAGGGRGINRGRVTRISVDNPFRYDPRDDDEVMQIISEIIASGVIYELGRLPAQTTTLH